jgi:hypothetical protein
LSAPDGAAGSRGAVDAAAGGGGHAGDQDASGDIVVIPSGDPGWGPVRRLTNEEYDNTVRDLLGVPGSARATFQTDPRAGRFAVIPDPVTLMTDSVYEQYTDTADALATAAFADPVLRGRIVTCQPTPADPTTCTRGIVATFGLRAWRRPLDPAEVDGLVSLSGSALADGASFEESIRRVVTAMLSSAPFLLRLELDPDPSSLSAHTLTPYELASRLSYLLWSSMPDARLFTLAADGTLASDATLRAEVGRMLADDRADGFIEGFAGPWLGGDEFATHQIEPAAAPDWDEALRSAMSQEWHLYVGEFLRADLDFTTFLDADFNFVNARLARHYGMDTAGLGDVPTRVVDTADHRAGFLGLGATLTATSVSTRSSPTSRGRWILDRLLCTTVPYGPIDTPDYIKSQITGTERALFDSIEGQQTCAGCHKEMDSVGMALEEFDQTGAFRTQYADGTPVDARGARPDGTPVDGERALAAGLDADPRLLPCLSRTALSYALNRELGAMDEGTVSQILGAWRSATPTLRALLETIVVNDTFRFRRGEGGP